MAASDAIHVVADPRYREHAGPSGHPECPERLAAVGRALDAFGDRLVPVEPREALPEEILRVHSREHLQLLSQLAGRAVRIDADTYTAPRSYEIALLAAGGVVELARRIARGEARSGLAAVRPPGHHAEAARAMGFCLLNNIAIAARALRADEGLDRVLIVDWDVHHGNGTQHSFEEDPSVLFVSTHQFPFYPGTGDAGEAGRGKGAGATVNLPLPAGCGDEEYLGAFQRVVAPVARAFRPEMILVSCGFDAHRDDPLASMDVTREGFAGMTAVVRALAEECCDGRVLYVLEGGYAPSGLEEGVGAVLEGMLVPEPALPPAAPLHAGSLLRSVVDRVAAVHGGRVPDLGAL